MIEAIEDALGNEIYYFFIKTDRKEFDRQKDFDEERMSVDHLLLLLIHLLLLDILLEK